MKNKSPPLKGNISKETHPSPITMSSSLESSLDRLECHFTWKLDSCENELKRLRRNLKEIDKKTCSWLVHYNNLLGYIQYALGDSKKALICLLEAESVIQKQGTEEANTKLQVNKANLAWVHSKMGNKDESRKYLKKVEELQQMHPAPAGCDLHPEVSGEKAWTLLKFDKTKKLQSIDFFKKALKAEPERKEWHKGLAIAMCKAYIKSEFTHDLNTKVVDQLKQAKERDPSDLYLQSLYLLKLSKLQAENNKKELDSLLEKTLDTGNMDGLVHILGCFRNFYFIDKALQEEEKVREKFKTELNSAKMLKIQAYVYNWKVYSMKEDSKKKQEWVKKTIDLFEEIVKVDTDSVREKVALATLYRYAHRNERANKIYGELLSQKNDFPLHSQQYLYHNYAWHLFEQSKGNTNKSLTFHMKAAEIPEISEEKQKSLKILENYMQKGKDPFCKEISGFLSRLHQKK